MIQRELKFREYLTPPRTRMHVDRCSFPPHVVDFDAIHLGGGRQVAGVVHLLQSP
jgi:hypothetical protein